MQYSSAIYLARLDQVEVSAGASPKLLIFSGAMPVNCAAADTGTLLATLTLPSDWMNGASGTTKTLLGSWAGSASGGAGATPAPFADQDRRTIVTLHQLGADDADHPLQVAAMGRR